MSQQMQKQSVDKGDVLRSFQLGLKELDDKTAEFMYDRGLYTIFDVNGEEKTEVYKSRNMQEAYMKWNVYIGRKKERPVRPASEHEEQPERTRNRNHSASGNGQKSNREVLAAEKREQCGSNGGGQK